MGWSNVRARQDLEFGVDPHARQGLSLARVILRRAQGVGLRAVLGADGDPEISYGGAYGPQVQPEITGAAGRIASPSVTRDMGGADIATGVTSTSSAAAATFAERLRRGRVMT